MIRLFATLVFLLFGGLSLQSQHTVTGTVKAENTPVGFATLSIINTNYYSLSDEDGFYSIEIEQPGEYILVTQFLGYKNDTTTFVLKGETSLTELNIELYANSQMMDEVVITGTMKAVSRLDSPVPVELYNPAFFKKNPTPNIFEGLSNINGVRPQVNCNVCNTGDFHINGLEGPYTMILIDGMPLVSSLSTVYGLAGIPNSLVERIEIVKGPASSLYGSEAIGGLINVITKSPSKASPLTADVMVTSWGELNTDIGMKSKIFNNWSLLTGINHFIYDNPKDYNLDNFTDISIQNRFSVFQKISFNNNLDERFNLAARYNYEDRWGGELQWNKAFKGSDQVYGESITTRRWEVLSSYRLPVKELITAKASYVSHYQDSAYGDLIYIALQRTAFAQLIWEKQFKDWEYLLGTSINYNYYDDNTAATESLQPLYTNKPDKFIIPGVFFQSQFKLFDKHTLLSGLRYDYHNRHGSILTPRLALKFNVAEFDRLRINAGTGFRVVNIFTEDHAALTGARDLVIAEGLNPEKSINININYLKRVFAKAGNQINLEAGVWVSRFSNAIFPDYDTDPNKIIYQNLKGDAISRGFNLSTDMNLNNEWSLNAGITYTDVYTVEEGIKERPLLTEKISMVWSISKSFLGDKLSVDFTGSTYSPMKLPLLGDLDPRPEKSPWYSIQNIQLSYQAGNNLQIYGGIKNILNWTPWRSQEHSLIARAHDPFDNNISTDASGNVLSTPDNPYALSFDPSYVYAPNQGRRFFIGVRYVQ